MVHITFLYGYFQGKTYTLHLPRKARFLIQTAGQRDEPPSKDIKADGSVTSRCELLVKRMYMYTETRVHVWGVSGFTHRQRRRSWFIGDRGLFTRPICSLEETSSKGLVRNGTEGWAESGLGVLRGKSGVMLWCIIQKYMQYKLCFRNCHLMYFR